MAVVMKQFIDRFKAMEKIANETLAAKPDALVGVESLPGAEHDAKVPAEAKKPDAEVTQGQPAGATSAEGAVAGGDAKPFNEGKLEVDQPLLNAEKKPLISDDALTAKEAHARLTTIVDDLLKDMKVSQKQASAEPAKTQAAEPAKTQAAEPEKTAEAQKQAQCGGAATTSAPEAKKDDKSKDEGEKNTEKKTEKKAEPLKINGEILSKIAAAQATFLAGRAAAEKAIQAAPAEKQASAASDDVTKMRALIKEACIKAAQAEGLDPDAAAAAADNAMSIAGIPAADATAEGAAAAPAEGAGLPEDVTEEELGAAIVDLVQSGELDPATAKALVEELSGTPADVTEDQAAEIVAKGLESGEITPEQAKAIASAIEGGASDDAAVAADAAAEAKGAADAEAAMKDAVDEAKGAADAEAAMKAAASECRHEAFSKVAKAIMDKREQVKKAEEAKTETAGSKFLSKVASILERRKEELAAKTQKEASANDNADAKYVAGFCKKAAEMGVDPKLLAQYVLANQKDQAK